MNDTNFVKSNSSQIIPFQTTNYKKGALMKKITFFLVLFCMYRVAFSQSVLHYNFLNSLNEVHGAGPALSVLGNAGSYEIDTLSEIGGSNKTVYRFEKNSGVQFNNTAAGNFIGETYTIELYFVFDELTSWKRVVDWKNRKTDNGAYVFNGELNFYNILYSSEAPVVTGQYTYYVITRDGASKKVLIYTDAEVKIDFTDNYNDALIDGDGFLNFFHDDLVVPNEASSGAVAMLNLYNYALDSNEIKTNWNSIGSTVFGMNDLPSKSLLKVFPNPATTQISINLSDFGNIDNLILTIVNENGQNVLTKNTSGSSSPLIISTSAFDKGIYIMRIAGGGKYVSSKFVIR
jgi:hypothetical protein